MKNIDLTHVVNQTIDNGGHTVDIGGRYMVALEEYELIVPVAEFNEQVLRKYIAKMPNIENATLGTWLHDNKVYIDISRAYNVFSFAVTDAIKANQLAIFDLENMEEIRLD